MITSVSFGIKSLCTSVPWNTVPPHVLQEALSAKTPFRFPQIKVRQVSSQVLILEGRFLLLPLSSWATWQKGRHLFPLRFQEYAHVFSQHWCLFAGGTVNSCPQSTERFEMREQLHSLPVQN